jgi:squalene synthase HpnC
MDDINKLNAGYKEAISFTKNHYENFPVLSFFIPKKLRKHIAVVYMYARQADDIADEDNLSVEERINLLENYEADFTKALAAEFETEFWMALANTVVEFQLTPENFFNLLIAFKQDLTVKRYKNFDALLSYCSYSANPVGRIILELYNVSNEEAKNYSDKICTALQITNFLQDVAVDILKDRIYIPLDEMEKFDVEENRFLLKQINGNFKNLMKMQIDRTIKLFEEGEKLLSMLPYRLRKQINWTINGGKGILKKIEANDYDVFNNRPKFSKLDLLKLAVK